MCGDLFGSTFGRSTLSGEPPFIRPLDENPMLRDFLEQPSVNQTLLGMLDRAVRDNVELNHRAIEGQVLHGSRMPQFATADIGIGPMIYVSRAVPEGEVWLWNPKTQAFDVIFKREEEFDMDEYNEALAEGAFEEAAYE